MKKAKVKALLANIIWMRNKMSGGGFKVLLQLYDVVMLSGIFIKSSYIEFQTLEIFYYYAVHELVKECQRMIYVAEIWTSPAAKSTPLPPSYRAESNLPEGSANKLARKWRS